MNHRPSKKGWDFNLTWRFPIGSVCSAHSQTLKLAAGVLGAGVLGAAPRLSKGARRYAAASRRVGVTVECGSILSQASSVALAVHQNRSFHDVRVLDPGMLAVNEFNEIC